MIYCECREHLVLSKFRTKKGKICWAEREEGNGGAFSKKVIKQGWCPTLLQVLRAGGSATRGEGGV